MAAKRDDYFQLATETKRKMNGDGIDGGERTSVYWRATESHCMSMLAYQNLGHYNSLTCR